MGFLFDEQRRLVRKDGSLVHRPKTRRGPRSTELSGRVSHLRVDFLLGGPGAMRDEYEKMLDRPTIFFRELQAWFAARGHSVTLSAIRRHKRRYDQLYVSERDATRLASAYCALTRRAGPGAMGEAALAKFEMGMMARALGTDGAPKQSNSQLLTELKVLHRMFDARRAVEEVRAKYTEKAKQVSEAVQTMNPGEVGKRTAAMVREIFGV
jgi:hypothetical protein